MYNKRFFGLLMLSFLLLIPAANAGDNESVKTMANIMMHLNHYPSDNEKNQLGNIAIESNSENIKIIATAMKNLEHSATSSDKQALQKVMNDKDAPENVKQLASIVYNLNHKPSSDDKAQLSTMINFASDN